MTPKQWLDSGRDYEAGRLLYAALGDNKRLMQLLSDGPNQYNREALDWELGKLARAGVVTDVTVNVTAGPVVVENATETLQPEPAAAPAENPLLVELAEARRPRYDERTLLHGQLEVLAEKGTEEEVRQAAERIMVLSRELNTNWQLDGYVREHGQLPPTPPPPPGLDTLTPAELVKKRNNLRSQVSKLKKRTDRADDLAKAEAQLQQVEALLNPAPPAP
jgi:hypothetical protein